MYFAGLKTAMEDFTFRIYAYNNYTYQFFAENCTIPRENLYVLNAKQPDEISLTGKKQEQPDVKPAAPKCKL
jgi:hypothetical protein